MICRLESTLGRVGVGGKGVALIGNLCNALALVISFFGEGGFTILTFGSILGFLEEALLARAFLFSGEVGGGELDCFGGLEDVMESPKCPTTLGGEMVGLVSSFSSFWMRGGAEVSLFRMFRSFSNAFILLGSSRMVSIVLEASTRLSRSSESLATCLE